ncbi:AMP-binding protein [Azospirillum halopraeferens]|uniref:AMP-binding protein n=1 Tax=Azospirillum halopraeferens TaxID=34010 RepID=UPI00041CAE66|nr:AMP-binding protein [Azospirillum halopraeferens]
MTEPRSNGAGTQSLERAIALLRVVAAKGEAGARLADLMAAAGLTKATTHRMLAALVREGLLEQDEATRRYHPGRELAALGRAAAARYRSAAPEVSASAYSRAEYRGKEVAVATLLCDRHLRGRGGRAALLHENVAGQTTELSFARLARESRRLASVLAGLGVARGDRVAVLLPKGPELLITAVAAWRLGAVYMPLFTTFDPPAVAVRLADSAARVVVTRDSLRHKIPRDPAGRRSVVTVESEEGFANGSADAVPFWSALHDAAPLDTVASYGVDDPFALIYTPETDRHPLGIPVCVWALAGVEQYMRVGLDLRDDDTYWNMADPGWAYGVFYGLIGPLLLGRTTIFCDGPYDARQSYRVLTKHGVTNLTAAPSQVRTLRDADPSVVPAQLALRVLSTVGEPLPADLTEWATGALKVPLFDQYGQSETGVFIVNRYDPDQPAEAGAGSLGRALPGYRVVVLDAEGREAPVGGVGEIAIDRDHSPLFWFDGYANAPERTAHRFRHGHRYYLTGDWACLGADGTIRYRGRVSDAVLMQQMGG